MTSGTAAQSSQVAPNIIWKCIKKNSCFIRRFNGVAFSAEKNNLTHVHCQKYSGLIGPSVGLIVSKGVVTAVRSTKANPRHVKNTRETMEITEVPDERKAVELGQFLAEARPDLAAFATKLIMSKLSDSKIFEV